VLDLAVVLGPALRGGDVGGEVWGGGGGLGGDEGVGDVGVLGEEGFDFLGFDAVAADFDLGVGAAVVGEGAVGLPAGDVTGFVEAGSGGLGDEALGGEGGVVVVAVGEAITGEV
jgi:hypothetical protein